MHGHDDRRSESQAPQSTPSGTGRSGDAANPETESTSSVAGEGDAGAGAPGRQRPATAAALMSHWSEHDGGGHPTDEKPAPTGPGPAPAPAKGSGPAGAAAGAVALNKADLANLDQIIATSSDLPTVLDAFQKYWQVTVDYKAAGVSNWDAPTLRSVHNQLKLLPPEHARNKDFRKLLRDFGGGGAMGSGTFWAGEQATAWTELAKDAKKDGKELAVKRTANFAPGDKIAVGDRARRDVHTISALDEKNQKITLDAGLLEDHGPGTRVVPDLSPRGKAKLNTDAKAGATEIHVDQPKLFPAGTRLSIGPRPSKDVVQIREVAGDKYVLTQALVEDHAKDTEVADEAAPYASDVGYGVGTSLTQEAKSGSKEIVVKDVARFATGEKVAIGQRPAKDVQTIQAVDAAAKKYTLDKPLQQGYGVRTQVVPDSDQATHGVDWVGALVRHEIAHSVDTALGGVTGFTQGLGGWWNGDDFDHWASTMGNPWTSSDGTVVAEADKGPIKQAIIAGKGGGKLGGGKTAGDVAVNKYSGKGVPVIEAARTCIDAGQGFWLSPEKIYGADGKRFSINPYYRKFQYYNEPVHKSRVRDYAIFAPAEFFAEVYTAYYEEAGKVPDADLGRLVPVTSWRDWITNNVHKRGLVPTKPGAPAEKAAGAIEGHGAPALAGASVGKTAGKPGA